MGRIRDCHSERAAPLRLEHMVGRSPTNDLVLDHPFVSARHALLRWSGSSWEARDLGSRNGTFVDGERLGGALARALRPGAVVAFGHADVRWELVDASPPLPMLVPVEGGEPVPLPDELVALPTADDPAVTIYRGEDGLWRKEIVGEQGTVEAIENGALLEAGGRVFRFCLPLSVSRTTTLADAPRPGGLRLVFRVSRDEEHVELGAEQDGKAVPLGASGRYYLLLTLARQRLADRSAGVPETSCGWMYQEELLEALDIGQQQLNIDVFRIRRQLAEKGLAAAASVIERRPRTRQIRCGVSELEIVTI